MNDWFFRQGGRDRLINWLGIDSMIDSTLAEAWARIQDYWNAGTSFFARFRLTGWRRIANELLSETFTLACGGFLVIYALAMPALLEFDEGRFLTGQYAVTILDKNGNEIGKRGILHNDAVPLEEIPDHLIKATLATEDRRFFDHWGVDFMGTARALIENMRANDVVQGGSTLSQQVAKNLFLSSERSIQRKVKEMFLSFLLESRYTKREILKTYLDRAYLGGGAFGVEAASQYYFGKSVRNIDMAEAALLAGLYKAPTKYAPHLNLAASRARTSEVLSNLVEAGFYTAGQVHAARINPAKVIETRNVQSPDWFLDWAFEEVQRIAEGKGQYVLTARTTIDLTMQRAADEALITTIRTEGKQKRFSSGAMVATEIDGAVRALVGGPDYGESQFNRATHAKRQPGSSFKPYVYATALENGWSITSTATDSSPTCNGWSPSNYSGGSSGRRVPLTYAMAHSLNTVAVSLSLKIGRPKVVEMTRRLGINGIRPSCSMALGDTGIPPIEHVGGMATFANGGRLAKPYGILELVNSKGELIYSRERDEPEARQVVSRKVVEQLNKLLQAVVLEGTGTRAALDFTTVVGKTGTSSNYKDAWFVGFTGKYVAGFWLGNDDNRPMREVTGGQVAAPAWHSFMSVVHTDMNIATIPGLEPHPVQVAEQQRLADVKAQEALNAEANGTTPSPTDPDGEQQKTSSLMPEQQREALKRIAQAMRKAIGGGDPALEPAKDPGKRDDGKSTAPPPDKRAGTPAASPSVAEGDASDKVSAGPQVRRAVP